MICLVQPRREKCIHLGTRKKLPFETRYDVRGCGIRCVCLNLSKSGVDETVKKENRSPSSRRRRVRACELRQAHFEMTSPCRCRPRRPFAYLYPQIGSKNPGTSRALLYKRKGDQRRQLCALQQPMQPAVCGVTRLHHPGPALNCLSPYEAVVHGSLAGGNMHILFGE